ncbi:hypothetical protein AQUCO_00400172v1 [Aquilegia coerulea]|uniref:Major facilitator superfamily (MFS) profile domain-containing protein n=1 Tax=Aquilegia coerulea TaxID=218851 RepID=A0A2G5ETR3_AQUCA|nr:hypothetical protein AQUCO_00400172v1 [Aquilegia coerulea]
MCVAGGQLLAYLISIAFSKVPGTWRWMLALEGVLAVIHHHLIESVPESPKLLYRMDREKAITILKFLYPSEAEDEIHALKSSVDSLDHRKDEMFHVEKDSILEAARNDTAFGRGMISGIGCLLAQQLVGINMVIHYSPKLLQMAGYNTTKRSNYLIIPGLSALGYLVSILFVDVWGRRKLLLISIIGIVVSLWMLSCAFNDATMNSGSIDMVESYFGNSSYTTSEPPISWNADYKGSTSFAGANMKVGIHIGRIKQNNQSSFHMEALRGSYNERSSNYNSGFLAFYGFQLYILFYSLGMGIVPWIINSEIYAYRFRFVGTQLALFASLVSNLFTSLLLSFISEALGSSNTFLLFCLVSCVVGLFIFLFVPETKGLRMEDITSMLSETEAYHSSEVCKDDDCCMESTFEELDV